jgi:hypothetical protein
MAEIGHLSQVTLKVATSQKHVVFFFCKIIKFLVFEVQLILFIDWPLAEIGHKSHVITQLA